MRDSMQGNGVPEELFTLSIPFPLIRFTRSREESKGSIGAIDFEAFFVEMSGDVGFGSRPTSCRMAAREWSS